MISGLSEKLRDLRLKRNLSQKELADTLGISPSIVSCPITQRGKDSSWRF